MKKVISVLLAIVFCLISSGCDGAEASYEEREFFVMDTVFTLRIYGENEENAAHFSRVGSLLYELEKTLSATHPESDVSRINRERTAGDLSPHTVSVLQTAAKVMTLTDGAYLPTMGALSALWKRAGEENTLPDPAVLAAALADARQGFVLEDGVCTLIGESALLDLGGIGKGYAADCVVAYLRDANIQGALLSFGSSVATVGEKGNGEDFTVGLRHPRDSAATVGTWQGPRGVLSVSGDYERYVTVQGARYHHVLDPQSGYPTSGEIVSVAVLCESGALSDALSTAFLVLGREKAEQVLRGGDISAEAVFINAAGQCFSAAERFVAK